jgi:hypothetical protein
MRLFAIFESFAMRLAVQRQTPRHTRRNRGLTLETILMADRPPFAFHCPQFLHDAMTAAARADFCSRSDVARQALIKALTERGLLKPEGEPAPIDR